MLKDRHPHPHQDPRQPRHRSRPGTNPPAFAFKPPEGAKAFCIQVARDEGFKNSIHEWTNLTEPVYLPEKALEPGTYFWKWSAEGHADPIETFSFEITSDAVTLEVPPVDVWLKKLSTGHPRLYLNPEAVSGLRDSRTGSRAEQWAQLKAAADKILKETHEMEEPPFLPDWKENYQKAFKVWYRVMHESRRFVKQAEVLGLAYVASGETDYARAACQRMASISKWDPSGSSHLSHNDEAHMSVIWHGPSACDFIWDRFTEAERADVIEQFRKRGEMVFEHMHGKSSYGVKRFDSHAGREIVFLAQIALVFHEAIPEAKTWLEWLRPVLCGIWPIWAGDDGAWAEGPSYGLAYVGIMTMFATSLKNGAGVDLYRRPFWKGHAQWRRWCWPAYVEWMGFGDHTERWGGTWLSNADLVETIARQTGTSEFDEYISEFREEAEKCSTPTERASPGVHAQRYLLPDGSPEPKESTRQEGNVLKVFPAAGWAAFRTDFKDPARDVALIFRSSPYGSISHSHANHNDFILHVGGKVLAMPSGYYDGYGSDHHSHWVWHTKSHNCLTLSDAPQVMRSRDAVGRMDHPFEDDRLAYLCGNGDAAYADRASRCRRHVAFLKSHGCFLMIDEFLAKGDLVSALQWNLHSWSTFQIDHEGRTADFESDGSAVRAHFLLHQNAFFSLSEGFDPPPAGDKKCDQWHPQHHLRFTPTGYVKKGVLGVLLYPNCKGIQESKVSTERQGDTEVARIGEDLVLLNQGKGIEAEGVQGDSLALLQIDGTVYTLGDEGIQIRR